MNRTIEVSEETYLKLERLASKEGESVTEWLESMVAYVKLTTPGLPSDGESQAIDALATGDPKIARTLYDLAGDLVGAVSGSGPTDLARNHSKYFLEYLLEKKRQGRL